MVRHNYQAPPHLRFYDLMTDAVMCLIKQVEVIQKVCSEPSPPAHTHNMREQLDKLPPHHKPSREITRRSPPVEPHRATPFGQLVQQIEERAQ